jgi:hypothetical protein
VAVEFRQIDPEKEIPMEIRADFSARMLAVLWALFWMFFFVAESIAWRTPVRMALLWAGLGCVFLAVAFLPFRWEVIGAFLLIFAGLAVGAAYSAWSPSQLNRGGRMITFLVLSLPPIASGTFLLLHRRSSNCGT